MAVTALRSLSAGVTNCLAGKNVWWSGVRQLLIGMAAAGVTFGIGHLFGVAVA